MLRHDPLRQMLGLAAAAMLVFMVFARWPGIDLWATGLFYDPANGFAAIDDGAANALRLAIWRVSEAVLVAAVLALFVGMITGAGAFDVPRRIWACIVLLYLLGPGLLVDVVLKRLWARARPADVTEFGGQLLFTPPHQFAHQCARNCSFVAGEMAGAVALSVALALLLGAWRRHISASACRLVWSVILVLPAYVGFQRLAAGRHFLSDVIFAAIFILMVAVVLRAAMFRPNTNQG